MLKYWRVLTSPPLGVKWYCNRFYSWIELCLSRDFCNKRYKYFLSSQIESLRVLPSQSSSSFWRRHSCPNSNLPGSWRRPSHRSWSRPRLCCHSPHSAWSMRRWLEVCWLRKSSSGNPQQPSDQIWGPSCKFRTDGKQLLPNARNAVLLALSQRTANRLKAFSSNKSTLF